MFWQFIYLSIDIYFIVIETASPLGSKSNIALSGRIFTASFLFPCITEIFWILFFRKTMVKG